MNVSGTITKDYETKSNWKLGKNKPNQTQSCPPLEGLSSIALAKADSKAKMRKKEAAGKADGSS